MCSFHVSSRSISAFPSPREQCSLDTRQALRKCLCDQRPGVSPEGSRPPLPTPPGDVVPQETQLGSRTPGTALVLGTVRVSHGCFPGSGSEKRLPFFLSGCPSGLSQLQSTGIGGCPPIGWGGGCPPIGRGGGEVHSQRNPRGLSPDEL